jgi:hypothetical protein
MPLDLANIPGLTRTQLERVRDFYEAEFGEKPASSRQFHALLGRYYAQMIPDGVTVLEIGCGDGSLLAQLPGRTVTGVDLSAKHLERAKERVPQGRFFEQAGEALSLEGTFDYIIIPETVNLAADVQRLFDEALKVAHPGTRLILNFYSTLWSPILFACTAVGLRARSPASNWLSLPDVWNMLELAGWQPLEVQRRILLPVQVPILSTILNRFLAPILPWFCLTCFCVARRRPPLQRKQEYTVSVVVPARNESGNIEAIVRRIPEMGLGTEILLIEGNSTDDTWEKMRMVAESNHGRRLKILQQTGRGKGNAVREGFAASSGQILMILDADLTVPPEELLKFYDVVASRHGEFANGVRLVYPMESEAMQFLNVLANKAFSIIFTWLLLQPVKDTLCGTKVLLRTDYDHITRNRAFFGEFDPFGDFDLLFGAAKLHLKIADIPVRYGGRTYGSTNINRWRHGWLLLRMVFFAARKLRFT